MKRSFFIMLTAAAILYTASSELHAQDGVNFTGQELLCRPTNSSVTINVVADQPLDAYFEYGTQPGVYTAQTDVVSSAANEPIKVVITGLQNNTLYYYRMVDRITGTVDWTQRAEHSFRTQRTPGTAFSFDITSDSHVNVGGLGSPAQWQQTLTNVGNDGPDFLIDCGDTYSMDNVTSESQARSSYIFQRTPTAFGLVSHSVPVLLAVGNHEEQEAWHLNDNGDPVNSQPVWGTNAQKRYFPNPVPDAFYTGDTSTYYALDGDQLREDYYAWTWGNALFIVIDPFWFTTEKPFVGNTGGGEPGGSDGDRWHWTLGDAQYAWLRKTLENSSAAYKFLFMHHMTGGTQDYIRGGAYAAPYCEWGGYDEDGTTYSFAARRPGWYAPVHQVLTENHVSAVFHGHDHQYAYEKRDSIVYQSLPAAGFSGNGFSIYSENDPLTIRVLPSPGHLRITVSVDSATVEYVSSGAGSNGQVVYSYKIAPWNGVLPVKIEYFTLQTENNKKVMLKWKTASEFQNKQFTVQRANAVSGVFKDIGTVAATNSPDGAIYSFTDEPKLTGSFLYRIIQEDMYGKKIYSDTRSATLRNNKFLQIADKGASWQLSSDQPVNYSLIDIQGRLIEKGSFSGTKNIIKPTAGSVYILRAESNGDIFTQKLLN